jgi:hypothetical protein
MKGKGFIIKKIMKYTIFILLFATCLLIACAPTGISPEPSISKTTAPLVSPTYEYTLTNSQMDGIAAQVTQEATRKPKGQKTRDASIIETDSASQDSQPESSNPDFLAPVITGRPTSNSITINAIPAKAMTISYEYGTNQGIYDAETPQQQVKAEEPVETTINGLQSGTRYYYRINYEGQIGEERSFVTQRPPGSTFTFDIQGDSHPERVNKEFNADLYSKTLQSAAADLPDFYLAMGDDFSVDSLKEVNEMTVRDLYLSQRQWLGLINAPVFLVNGNHEQASLANLNVSADNVAVWAQNARNDFFPQPAPDGFYSGDSSEIQFIGQLRDYYAFTWGDALFMVIDPYWHSPQVVDNAFGAKHGEKPNRDLWNVTLGDEQYRWFLKTLENSNAKYKFVFSHHVLGIGRGGVEEAGGYEWGDAAGLGTHRPGWEKTIQQVMADNQVTIFFQGHDHIFVKQELDGVIYQTLPEPADPNYSLFNSDSYPTGVKFPNSGHVRVSVSTGGITVDYVRSYLDRPDEIAYSYTVK